ncbi:MAG: hypothetical protein M0R22_09000, partial [Dehalococcoidia bacterium]|nr:hypothetical protein [Dehalococcoidia bacterium]
MASSQNLSGELAQALRARDEARRLLASAEQLSTDESVSEEHREALAQEYGERVSAGDAEVERIKSLIRDERAGMVDELAGLRKEESALDVRQKVGEYTPAQFKDAIADLRRRMDSLARLDTSFAALLEAETESDVKPASRRAGVGSPAVARAKVSLPVERSSEPEAAGGGLRSGFATASAVTPRWLLLGSLGLVIVGGLAVAVLFFNAAIGGGSGLPGLPSLPSLSGLLPGGEETPTTPTTPLMPTREPTTPAATTPATSTPAATAETTMSIDLRAAPNVGSLLIDVAYDPAALELVRVQGAGLPSSALFEYGVSQGHVVLGVVTTSGLNGDWSVGYLVFKRAAGAATSGQSAVAVSSVQAHRADNLASIAATAVPGRVNLADLSA